MQSLRVDGLDEETAESLREDFQPRVSGGALIEEELPARDAAERDAAATRAARFALVLYALDDDEALVLERELLDRGLAVHRRDLGDVDWESEWRRKHPPLSLGDRVLVVPPWATGIEAGDRLPVVIEPGMAFGLGDAPSTRFSLELLEQALRPGDRVADLGCGTGLLAIAARRLGAGAIAAADTDPLAIEAACANARLNGIVPNDPEADPAFLVTSGSVAALPGPFDLVVANIVWEIIEPMLADIVLRLTPGGSLVVGGIRPRHIEALRERASALGLRERARRANEEIAALLLA